MPSDVKIDFFISATRLGILCIHADRFEVFSLRLEGTLIEIMPSRQQ